MSQIKSLRTGIKFKDTPVGKIPVDWEATQLRRVGVLKGGNGFPEKYQGHKNKDFFFLKVSDMNLPGNETYIKDSINTIDETIQSAIRCNLFPKSTIIFAKVGAALLLNRRRILTKESCIDNNMMGLIVNKEQNFKFYFYVMQSIDFAKYVSSGALPSINQAVIGDIDVAGPPLPEQKKIAEILTTVDDAVEETDRIIEKTKELKKGMMQKLLTRGIGHKKFKKTEIGEMPAEWETVRLNEVVKEFYNGGTPDTKIKEYWDGNIPWVTGADFINQRIDLVRRYITLEGVKNSATNVIAKGNLLVVTRTGVGKLAIAPFDIAISQDITGVITNAKRLQPDFLYCFLYYHEKKLKSLVQGTSINGLLREDLASLNICLPPLKEQKEITDILTTLDLDIENEKAIKQNLETLKKSLMQVLLTGRVRV